MAADTEPDLVTRQLAWAWRQEIEPEEKLLLLALCTGEAEPNHHEALKRTGLGFKRGQIVVERLFGRGLVDVHGAPTFGTGEQETLESEE